MITGLFQSDEARIPLTVFGTKGKQRAIDAVIDTGYTSWLSLPPAIVAALGLQWQTFERGILADGSEVLFDVYLAEVVWDGKTRRLLVDEADTDPLVGMALLRGHELKMQIRRGGRVTIKRLPQSS